MRGQRRVRINPKRKHTEAEVRLVMDVYACDEQRARAILNVRSTPADREEIRGMIDAIGVEQAIAEGKVLKIPGWLIKQKMV